MVGCTLRFNHSVLVTNKTPSVILEPNLVVFLVDQQLKHSTFKQLVSHLLGKVYFDHMKDLVQLKLSALVDDSRNGLQFRNQNEDQGPHLDEVVVSLSQSDDLKEKRSQRFFFEGSRDQEVNFLGDCLLQLGVINFKL